MGKKADIDWGKLGFDYIKTDLRYISVWKDGNGMKENLLKTICLA